MNINTLPAKERIEFLEREREFCKIELDRFYRDSNDPKKEAFARWEVLRKRNQFLQQWFNEKINKLQVTYNSEQLCLL